MKTLIPPLLLLLTAAPAWSQSGDTIQGRWKLLKAEDLRADGTAARLPWGEHPIGSIVVKDGSCYLQIMSSDVPAFTASTPVRDQMKAAITSTYISYSGPCTTDDAAGTLKMTVDAAWTTNYVGTTQERFYKFENGRLLFGPAQGSMRLNGEQLTRRLTLQRVE